MTEENKKPITLLEPNDSKNLIDEGFLNCYFGCLLKHGTNVLVPSIPQAFDYFKKSAELGFPEGMFELSRCYLNEYGVDKDEKSGLEWLQKASDKGFAKAQYELAQKYFIGNGIPMDRKKAFDLYMLSAQKGHLDSISQIMQYYAPDSFSVRETKGICEKTKAKWMEYYAKLSRVQTFGMNVGDIDSMVLKQEQLMLKHAKLELLPSF